LGKAERARQKKEAATFRAILDGAKRET
jgi:hypothetical protein